MKVKIAIAMSIIAIAMLIIYGADVMSAGMGSGSEKTGFLHMSASVRGPIFGIIPAALLIISYFITRKEPSKILGILIIIGGALIIVGISMILAMPGASMDARASREFYAILGIGVFIAAIGGLKIKKNK